METDLIMGTSTVTELWRTSVPKSVRMFLSMERAGKLVWIQDSRGVFINFIPQTTLEELKNQK